ncbi:MAG: endonuclease III [Bacteroidaceae bacterium]|nr:endonuclease III [Bacteroidaceae bacterium]MBQ9169210.1 endonuclease III [Bacteroidaceae bacterium]MBQ9294498.1 endonuclease III [Bacteroidaceae bacterium]
MTRKELYREVAEYFRKAMPEAKTELHYNDPFQLLVAVILSAQCTDKRINQVTPRLFEDYPNAEAMALASPEVIYDYIRSVSYPNSKAKHLAEMARMLWEKHGGEVPQDMKQLTELPGVGRKTANVVLSVVWGEARMAVDTHVFRVSHRLGLVPKTCTTPFSVEQTLTRFFNKEDIPDAHHWLILHGRYTCTSQRPKCDKCGISHLCKTYQTKNKIKKC